MTGARMLLDGLIAVAIAFSVIVAVTAIIRFVRGERQDALDARRRIHAIRDRVHEPLRAPGNRYRFSRDAERNRHDA